MGRAASRHGRRASASISSTAVRRWQMQGRESVPLGAVDVMVASDVTIEIKPEMPSDARLKRFHLRMIKGVPAYGVYLIEGVGQHRAQRGRATSSSSILAFRAIMRWSRSTSAAPMVRDLASTNGTFVNGEKSGRRDARGCRGRADVRKHANCGSRRASELRTRICASARSKSRRRFWLSRPSPRGLAAGNAGSTDTLRSRLRVRLRDPRTRRERVVDGLVSARSWAARPMPTSWFADAEASRRHARFECRTAVIYLRDLQSSNGTFLNGARVTAGDRNSPRRRDRCRNYAPDCGRSTSMDVAIRGDRASCLTLQLGRAVVALCGRPRIWHGRRRGRALPPRSRGFARMRTPPAHASASGARSTAPKPRPRRCSAYWRASTASCSRAARRTTTTSRRDVRSRRCSSFADTRTSCTPAVPPRILLTAAT